MVSYHSIGTVTKTGAKRSGWSDRTKVRDVHGQSLTMKLIISCKRETDMQAGRQLCMYLCFTASSRIRDLLLISDSYLSKVPQDSHSCTEGG